MQILKLSQLQEQGTHLNYRMKPGMWFLVPIMEQVLLVGVLLLRQEQLYKQNGMSMLQQLKSLQQQKDQEPLLD